jgi:hypothetical protein
MTKSKVGAEPKVRTVHYFNKYEGFHVGVNRDEWGCFDSYYYPYCFINGYFFSYSKYWIKNTSFETIKERWDTTGYGNPGYKSACIGIVDRKRKIAVIKENEYYSYSLQRALSEDYIIYIVHNFPCFDVCNPKNKKLLIKEVVKTIIRDYVYRLDDEYKVLNGVSKYCIHEDSVRTEYITRLKTLTSKYKFIPHTRKLWKGDKDSVIVSQVKVNLPSVDEVLNDTIFNEKERTHIDKCNFYTKYVYNNNITDYSWKYVDKHWNTTDGDKLWQIAEEDRLNQKLKELKARYNEALIKANHNKQDAIKRCFVAEGITNLLDAWRKDYSAYNYKSVEFMDVRYVNNQIEWFKQHTTVKIGSTFDNTQLRLSKDTNNVVTSRFAIVPLKEGIKLFNILYTKYIAPGNETFVDFTNKHIKLGYYQLRHIAYKEKVTDTKVPLGYKEWLFQIGCHTLWFDDIKDFIKYYHLEDEVAFPIDIDSKTCMNYNIVHCSTK